MIEELLQRTGHDVQSLAEGVSKVTVDLGAGRQVALLAFYQEPLQLEGERLLRLCAHTGMEADDPHVFKLLERAADLAIGGFTTTAEDGPILLTYTTYVDGLEPTTVAMLCTVVAWTTHAMLEGAQRGAPPGVLSPPERPPAPIDVAALLLTLSGGEPIFRAVPGGLIVRVVSTPEGLGFGPPPAAGEPDDGDGVDVRILTGDLQVAGEALVMVCAPMARVDGPPDVGAHLARGLLELNTHLQLGKFFSTGEGLVLFGHTALGRLLTPPRLARIVALVAEAATSGPDGEGGDDDDLDDDEGGDDEGDDPRVAD